MPTYQAFTTTGSHWRFLCAGACRNEVDTEARQIITGGDHTRAQDIYVGTELLNLIVLPASRAQRKAEFRHAVDAATLGV